MHAMPPHLVSCAMTTGSEEEEEAEKTQVAGPTSG
jgi:hypothetical protein